MGVDTRGFDLRNLPTDFYADPYPYYRALQQEAPVYELPGGGFFLTRYADLQTVYRDARRFSSDKKTQFAPIFGESSPLFEHHTTSLVFNDPPLHTNVRRAIGNALSNRMVEVMRDNVEALVESLLDRFVEKTSIDLIADFAAAIPVEVIGNLLRIPESDREPLRRWSLAILGSLEVGPDEFRLREGNGCVTEFLEYLELLISKRQSSLSDDEDDIVARLLKWDVDGYSLSPLELHHQLIFLLNAGHETTSNLIGNGVELLLRFQDEKQALLKDPTLLDTAIEECLRFESSNQLGNRTTTSEVIIGGKVIGPGTVLTLCIGAANRDGDIFENPDVFDVRRIHNPHLAFGGGIHTCAGLNVARLEGHVAISKLLTRYPGVCLAGEPVRARRARFRGFESLPVTV